MIGSKQLDHVAVAYIYAFPRNFFLWIYLCLVSSCIFAENCKLSSRPFQLGQYSCTTSTLQWSELNTNCILVFSLLLLVNVATFVVVLWLFWFIGCLDFPLLHLLYNPLLAICIPHLLDCSLSLDIKIGILQNFLLLLWKKSCSSSVLFGTWKLFGSCRMLSKFLSFILFYSELSSSLSL